MKRVLFSVLVLVFVLSACAGRKVSKQGPGNEVYEGVSMGYRGPIVLQVRLSGGDITEITIVDSAEDPFVGGRAMEELIDMVIEYNSVDIDVISGATATSKGFLEAARNAILQK